MSEDRLAKIRKYQRSTSPYGSVALRRSDYFWLTDHLELARKQRDELNTENRGLRAEVMSYKSQLRIAQGRLATELHRNRSLQDRLDGVDR